MNASYRQTAQNNKTGKRIYIQWLAALVMLVLLLGLCHSWLDSQEVSHVHIEGNMKYTDKTSLQAAVSPWLSAGMLHLPIRDIRSAVLADKWVDKVQLRKLWPNTLVLHVAEQRPVASWQQDAYLNYRGEAFFPHKMIDNQELPALSGPEGEGAAILEVYQHLSAVAAARGLRVTGLNQNHLENFNAELNNGMSLRLGGVDVKQNINKFADLFDGYLQTSEVAVTTIDLRYNNGAAVAWQPANELASVSSINPRGDLYER